MRKVKKKIILPLFAVILILFTLLSLVITAKNVNLVNGATMLGSVFIAPGAAFDATEKYVQQKNLQLEGIFEQNTEDVNEHEQNLQQEQPQNVNSNEGTSVENNIENSNSSSSTETSNGSLTNSTQQTNTEEMPQGAVQILPAFYKQGTGDNYIQTGSASIINYTDLSSQEVAQQVGKELPFSIEFNSDEPQVLIMHTHATESFEAENRAWTYPDFTARSTDNTLNITSIGSEIVTRLNAAGINTLHDVTLHDYPSYTGSYERSKATVQQYLQQYPSIKVVIDVHRDAIQKEDGTRIKPVAQINGKQAAQVMIISCADKNSNIPNYKENLKFAANWQAQMELMYPGLARPAMLDYRYYNQDLTTGSLLLEVGSHANTLQEAMYSAELVSNSLIALFLNK